MRHGTPCAHEVTRHQSVFSGEDVRRLVKQPAVPVCNPNRQIREAFVGADGHRMTKPKGEKDERRPEAGGYGVNGSRLFLRAALITAAFVAADGVILYFGTQTSWTFVHRWVLMAAGVGSGIGWAALMMSTGHSIKRMSRGFK